jgi:hypothetical protein
VGEATNATGLPTAARKITQRFGDLTFGITFVNVHCAVSVIGITAVDAAHK